jgi:zinc transporter ZupT
MTDKALLGLFASLGLALIHLFASKLRFLDVIPRSRWLSFAGGVSIAYALIHLLPELEEYRKIIASAGEGAALEHALYLLALAGLIVFYGLEKMVRSSSTNGAEKEEAGNGVFWIHISSFAVYNLLIGYALVKEERSLGSLPLFFVALGLHCDTEKAGVVSGRVSFGLSRVSNGAIRTWSSIASRCCS